MCETFLGVAYSLRFLGQISELLLSEAHKKVREHDRTSGCRLKQHVVNILYNSVTFNWIPFEALNKVLPLENPQGALDITFRYQSSKSSRVN